MQNEGGVQVMFREVCLWSEGYPTPLVEQLSFTATKEDRLLVVIGPVGAGKSTILHTILGENSTTQGNVIVQGSLTYAGQEPWIFPGCIRDNILFGLPYQLDWYNKVIAACSLEKDISLFPMGDQTLIGERGVGLSGGQKARISLARAVYCNSQVYLLDDPLSAVDTAVSKHIFNECIQGLLKDRVVILVTHQLQYVQQADKILVLQKGVQKGFGHFSELKALGLDVGNLLEELEEEEELDGNTPSAGFGEQSGSRGGEPHPSARTIATSPSRGMDPFFSMSASVFTGSALSVLSAVSERDAYEGVEMADEEKSHGGINTFVYLRYFKAGGGYLLTAITAIVFLLGEVSLIFTDLWLAEWANSDSSECRGDENTSMPSRSAIRKWQCTLDTGGKVSIYSGLVWLCVIILLVRISLLFYIAMRASRRLHNRMLSAVLRAPMKFFETNPLGRILNRFSRDVGFLDDQLPFVLAEFLQLAVHIAGTVLLAVFINVWIIIPAILLAVALLGARLYYIRACRELKRLEAIARSPLYAHLSNSLGGLTTIRSYGMQGDALEKYYHFQDENTKGWSLYIASIRWFGVRTDMMCACFVAVVTFASIRLAGTSDAALVGLALTYMISMAALFQYVIRQSADLESLMVSTERVIAYSYLSPEAPLYSMPPHPPPSPAWPEHGEVKIKRMSLAYGPRLPKVLRNITCLIKPGEKVGVVGRTGAGKSSLLTALFRLSEPDGMVEIDGVCISDIGLHELRRRLSIIPQEPVLFSGSLRYNLDPFHEYQDFELWAGLEQVELKEYVNGLGGLGWELSEGGANFSVGQRQLVCLARALLKRNKILVLDEATANVDIKTDVIIQKTLREQFESCTVITIAHRLNSVMNSDKIMVLDCGRLKEFDSPHKLLQRSNGLLTELVRQSGDTEATQLWQMAHNSFLQSARRMVDKPECTDLPSTTRGKTPPLPVLVTPPPGLHLETLAPLPTFLGPAPTLLSATVAIATASKVK